LTELKESDLEPRIVTDEFVSCISSMKKLCPHFHLSLQSGCDKTLKAMNRKYDTAEYLKGCEILRKYYDNPAITTDVIVGFPGETEEDFKITKAFVEKVHFYEMHIFKYSRRKGTVADTMPDQVDDKIKTARSNELIELANEMSAQYRSTYADSDLSVLIEEKQNIAGKEYYTGYTPNYIRVMISAEEFDKENVCSNSGNGNIINNIYTVKGCGLDKEKLHIIGMENYNG
jgi:threonylcarbamoyladenosine tRNA methylthiotransferase MtaB